jgi:hypothetical protein
VGISRYGSTPAMRPPDTSSTRATADFAGTWAAATADMRRIHERINTRRIGGRII